MNIRTEWNKIVTNALSVLVATIIVGAGGIVWERASAAREEIRELRDENKKIIELFSDKHATHDVQIMNVSNQMNVLIHNQEKLIADIQNGRSTATTYVSPKTVTPDPEKSELRQKALNADMIKQFSLPRK